MYGRPVKRQKPRTAQLKSFPAATGGWVANQNITSPESRLGAFKLQNYFPATVTNILRRGSEKYATVGDGSLPAESLMAYKMGANRALFAATEDSIYPITTVADPDVSPTAVVTGMTSGVWSSVQFATTGGTYLINVNGSDLLQLYDGSTFYAIGDQDVNRLNFDAETLAFTVGQTLTGGTSGATAEILKVESDGSDGFLLIGDITGGPFDDNETITDGAGGSATADGVDVPLFVGITGTKPDGSALATSDFIYTFIYKNRLFFIEKESMRFWYLPIDQIGGTATPFPMGGVFALGGSLMFGSSWSLGTSGDGGLSEQCAFITTEGEVAVYQGDNPATAATWDKVGTYRVGKPLGPKGWIRAGGDLALATDIGFVPLSQAIQRDFAALSPAAISFPIEDEWRNFVRLRSSGAWHCEVWPENQMAVIALPTVNGQPAEMLVVNVRTGAWAEYTNWDGNCLEVFNGRLFFGSVDGKVVEANVSGLDQGETYTGLYVPLFDDCGTPGSLKIPQIGRVFLRAPREATPSLAMQFDYIYEETPPPSAPVIAGASEWGVGIWGEAIWGEGQALKSYMQWQSIGGTGYAMTPEVQITSGSLVPLDVEIIRIEITYDTGDIVS